MNQDSAATPRPIGPDQYEVEVEVVNAEGLHARPATTLVKAASSYTCEIKIAKGDTPEVDAKSILQLLGLSADRGSRLTVRCTGSDAQAAADELAELFRNGFNERPAG